MDSIVVMGVAGCGKSSLGAALAQGLGLALVEGDDFHPEVNQQKMRASIAANVGMERWTDTQAQLGKLRGTK